MNKSHFIETENLNAIPMSDQINFRLNEIDKIKDYFNSKNRKRNAISKKLIKYIDALDYADKIFTVLSAYFGTLSIASHAAVVEIPVGLAGASLTVVFSQTTGIVKKLLNMTREKKQ